MQVYFADHHASLMVGGANIKAQWGQDAVRTGRFSAAAHPQNSPFAQVEALGFQIAAPSRETFAICVDGSIGEGSGRSGAPHLRRGDCSSVSVDEELRFTPGSPECFAHNQRVIESRQRDWLVARIFWRTIILDHPQGISRRALEGALKETPYRGQG